jgi:signal transduction histidine kinase
MIALKPFQVLRSDWLSSVGREQQIKDYLTLTRQLIWQRQAAFGGAVILSALYFDFFSTVVLYSILLFSEAIDLNLERRSRTWDGQDPVFGGWIQKQIHINTVISATAISAFVVNMAIQQTSGGHFTPLFFLFSASLFAAMYTSQMIGVLFLRLSIYGLAFLCIAFLDVVRYLPPPTSQIWMDFFTIIFVLYFIVHVSVKFYRGHQQRLDQMALIKKENERTQAAYEVKSQFLSTVSHELRTPLTSVKGSLDLINSGRLGEVTSEVRPLLDMAGKNSRRLAHLIDDLLDLQKIEAGDIPFNFEPVAVNDLVQEAVDTIAGYAGTRGIRTTTVHCVEECHILGDRSRLLQVMHNLLSNALKFSEEGDTVEVRVEILGDRVRISVHDQGIGIPDDAKDRVFGRFSQIETSNGRRGGGSGLGLSIAKKIVETHDAATIDYVSDVGVGSTFFLEFDRLSDNGDAGTGPEPVAEVA